MTFGNDEPETENDKIPSCIVEFLKTIEKNIESFYNAYKEGNLILAYNPSLTKDVMRLCK